MISEEQPTRFNGRLPLVVGRAATAIYAILKSIDAEGGEVLLPANICPAAIFPVLYAGAQPVFCDVDKITGNVTFETVSSRMENCTRLCCAILPHMYGNPISCMPDIVSMLHTHGVYAIEDCASAMGACYPNGSQVGSVGDYSVYSFGYSKTISLGFGGLLVSNVGREFEIQEWLSELPFRDDSVDRYEEFLSRCYRQLRNLGTISSIESQSIRAAGEIFKGCFLYMLDASGEKEVLHALDGLDRVISQRRDEWAACEKELNRWNFSSVSLAPFSSGAVPWRFNFQVPANRRSELISLFLKQNLPISDWYPCVAGYFSDECLYVGALEHGTRICNFPLLVGKQVAVSNVKTACEIMYGLGL
ncbi:hypothetical protein J2S71_000328 [Olsenella profusa DSM 13989]|uniref:DegT/DnrJ/EryC1/StrS family aminotransferase n=1 Tax=Olsenella profusa TaxID=138595 RepID=UPI0027848D0C|nr:DegT/DnrJ/EryC1/StrS family aminotransferase [Olsenella profusa]MDP9858632.1 hypothetical protein [Olsenella profusa DSM 13989]